MELSAKMVITGLLLAISGGVGWAIIIDTTGEKIAKSVMFIGVLCMIAGIMVKIWN